MDEDSRAGGFFGCVVAEGGIRQDNTNAFPNHGGPLVLAPLTTRAPPRPRRARGDWISCPMGSRLIGAGADTVEYIVCRILYSSGKDLRSPEKRFLASGDLRGGPASFWGIEFHTVKSHRILGFLDILDDICNDIDSYVERRPRSDGKGDNFEIVYEWRAEARFMEVVHDSCLRNCGPVLQTELSWHS